MEKRKRVLNNGPIIKDEKETVEKMVKIYCKRKHHRNELCPDCQDLLTYAHKRLSFCRFGEEKSACSNCKVHCYKPVYREKIKKVMRYSGAWMIVYHPVYSVKHLLKK